MKRTHKIVAGIIATLALGLAAAAYAHPGGFGPCAGDGPRGEMVGPRGMAGHRAGLAPAANVDSRLGLLKSQLKITAEQDGAWQAFAAKAKKQSEDMQAMRSKMQQAAGPAPERMGQTTEMMRARLAGMETMAAALKDLYAQLSPEQKTIADQHFGANDAIGGHRMGHHMRHR